MTTPAPALPASTASAWLTLTLTTWFDTRTTGVLEQFTCPPGSFSQAPGILTLASSANTAAPFTHGAPPIDSTIYSCSYLIADGRAVSPTSTHTTSPTASSSRSTASATHSAASHQITHTKTNVGAIAGAAIGAGILGLIVGAIICFLCLGGKRRKRRGSIDPAHHDEGTAMATFLPSAPPPKDRSSSRESVRNNALLASVGGGGSIYNVLSSIGIHEGASDEEIKSELSALGYLLQEHIQNNYHLDPLDGYKNEPFKMGQALSDPAFGLDDRNQALIFKLSKDPQTRFTALRHFLALTIFSALDLHHARSHPGSASLLPRQVTFFLESIPSAGMGKNDMTPQTATALNLWRRLSAYLLLDKPPSHPISRSSPTSPTNNPSSEDNRCSSTTIASPNNQTLTPPSTITAQVTSLRASLNKFLGMFVHSDRRAIFDQERNLEGVIQECVSFGYLLFAHGCEWRFVFDAPEEREDDEEEEEEEGKKGMRLLVLPGLEKLGDGRGKVFEVPKRVVEGESVVV